jgi:hypothetical protein
MLYTVWSLSKLYEYENICKNNLWEKEEKEATAQIGTNVRARVFNAGLLARSQFASGRSATGQLDQGFPWFSLVPEQMLSWYPNSRLH